MCPEIYALLSTLFQLKSSTTIPYAVCSIISAVLLVLTFILYIILPDLNKPFFGKLMMAFILALLVAYVSFAVAALGGTDFLDIKPGCIFLGFWVQVGTKICVHILA